MRANWTAVLAAALLSGCVTAAQMSQNSAPPSFTPMMLSPAQIKIVQAGTKKGLKDPDSARFGDIFLASVDDKGVITVCGYVNAKNSFGGYTGMEPFLGLLSNKPPVFIPVAFGGTDSETWAVNTQCAIHGLKL